MHPLGVWETIEWYPAVVHQLFAGQERKCVCVCVCARETRKKQGLSLYTSLLWEGRGPRSDNRPGALTQTASSCSFPLAAGQPLGEREHSPLPALTRAFGREPYPEKDKSNSAPHWSAVTGLKGPMWVWAAGRGGRGWEKRERKVTF